MLDVEHRTPERRKKRPPRTTPRRWTDRLITDDRRMLVISLDDRSRDSDQTSDSSGATSTPTSVLINGYPLAKDLSDLSGSYLNGNTAPRNVNNLLSGYLSDQSETSYQRPWKQAHVMSSREPVHPQPPRDPNDSFDMDPNHHALTVVDDCGIIEIIRDQQINNVSIDNDDSTIGSDHPRIPIILLLMDPGRKSYELMQLWVDAKEDTVRDVLHVIQTNLGDHWRQDYDGIFHVRNNHFSQLIHILNIQKYDAQPFELWVAKPWSMSSKNTVGYAIGLVNHLKLIGVFVLTTLTVSTRGEQGDASSSGDISFASKPTSSVKDSCLLLSEVAKQRLYVPNGILHHRHAVQFLSFSPSFEISSEIRVDVLGTDSDEGSVFGLDGSATFDDNDDNNYHGGDDNDTNKTQSFATKRALSPPTPTTLPDSPGRRSTDDPSIQELGPRRRKGLARWLDALSCCRSANAVVHAVPTASTTNLFHHHLSYPEPKSWRDRSAGRTIWETAWEHDDSDFSESDPLLPNISDSNGIELFKSSL